MKRTLMLALPLVLVLAAAGSQPAAGSIGFSAFGGFRVGGLHFDVGLHHPGPAFRSGYFYRVGGPVPGAGHRCGSACYRSAGLAYHHYGCPVVLHHFRAYGFAPPVFGPYGFQYDTRYRRYWDRGHDHHYDGRWYRWDWRRHPRSYGHFGRHWRQDPWWWRGRGRGPDRRYDGRYDRRYDDRYDRRWDSRRDSHRDRGRYDGRYERRGDDDRWRDRYRGRAYPRDPD